jgi:protein arginine kinase
VVISSRVRLARNLAGSAFPGWAGEDERRAVCQRLCSALIALPELSDGRCYDMGDLQAVEREVLKERQLISYEMAERRHGSALVASGDGRLAIMVNEEDHLRLQAMSPGMNLQKVWKRIDAVDSGLEQREAYAFSPQLGYLTACPSNVGTGLRASVMVHLGGLRLQDEVDAVVRGLHRMGLEVRGLLGEGTEAAGNMFQVSNRETLGESEGDIIRRLSSVVGELVRHETHARARLQESRLGRVMDHVSRAVGLLTHAHYLSSREAVELLSALRLGVEMDVLHNLTIARINELMLLIQPGHMQMAVGRPLGPDERDERRARTVRAKLEKISIREYSI